MKIMTDTIKETLEDGDGNKYEAVILYEFVMTGNSITIVDYDVLVGNEKIESDDIYYMLKRAYSNVNIECKIV